MTNLAVQDEPLKWKDQTRPLSTHVVSAPARHPPGGTGERPFRGWSRGDSGQWDIIGNRFGGNPPRHGSAMMESTAKGKLVTLPDTTPVSESAALQDDLRCAGIEPYSWIINRGLAGSGTTDPLLRRRMLAEAAQIERVRHTAVQR